MGIEEIIIEMAKQEGRKEGKVEGRMEGKVEGKVEGKEEGRMERNEIFVKNLLISSDFDDEKIASLVGVEVDFVKAIKKSFKL